MTTMKVRESLTRDAKRKAGSIRLISVDQRVRRAIISSYPKI